jgi:hypothetical protein
MNVQKLGYDVLFAAPVAVVVLVVFCKMVFRRGKSFREP